MSGEDLVLDIGCGHQSRGDVNVDLYPGSTQHRIDEAGNPLVLNLKLIPNFVRADAQFLPFKDECFSTVRSSHVIEHVAHPMLMLKEMLRVSNLEVVAICPHRYGVNAKQPKHINFFNLKWFHKAFSTFKNVYAIETSTTQFRYFPHVLFPLFQLPSEIKVVVRKRKRG
jgi:ubiquinone/menaquinone biosynthesis C-methylase UbiE